MNAILMKAVEDHDVLGVRDCLAKGADPNYTISWGNDDTHQPTTPLRMVVFRISDSFLVDDDLKEFSEIAKLLLQYGAEPTPAQLLAQLRYGKFDPTTDPNPFSDVLRIIERASVEKPQ